MPCSEEDDLKYQLKPIRIRSESGEEDVYYPLTYDGLPEEAILYAERELNETKENKANGIRKLKEYMKRENLTCYDERMLITALRHSKYNFEKAETKLKDFLKLRQVYIDKLTQMDTNKISLILEEFIFLGLPYRDRHGRGIIHSYPSPNLEKYEQDDILACAMFSFLYYLTFPISSIYGVTHLGDSSTPNVPLYYPVFKLGKAVVKHLVMFHGSDFDSVHKVFHPDILPCEIGGTAGPLGIEHYKEDLMCFIERLRNENSAKDI